jgi:acetyltransferase-like isoleucine patch superfamily enzyme
VITSLQILYRFQAAFASRMRNLLYRALGVRMQGYVLLRRVSIPTGWSGITLERGVGLEEGVQLKLSGDPSSSELVIGAGTYVNSYTIISAGKSIKIGRNCLIGSHCFITDGVHGTAPGTDINFQPTTYVPVVIEDGVWIGAGCVVLAGVRLGSGSIIGAGSIVTQDVPPATIAVSTSARVIKFRDR